MPNYTEGVFLQLQAHSCQNALSSGVEVDFSNPFQDLDYIANLQERPVVMYYSLFTLSAFSSS